MLAEMVDMFPTLASLAGLPDPRKIPGSEGINGTSLAPALVDPANATYMKEAAFSQFSKNNAPGDGSRAGGTSVACTYSGNIHVYTLDSCRPVDCPLFRGLFWLICDPRSRYVLPQRN